MTVVLLTNIHKDDAFKKQLFHHSVLYGNITSERNICLQKVMTINFGSFTRSSRNVNMIPITLKSLPSALLPIKISL